MNAAAGHVRRHHKVRLAVLEALHGGEALALRNVAGEFLAIHAFAAQIAHQTMRLIAAVHEHQRVIRAMLPNERKQRAAFAIPRQRPKALLHGVHRHGFRLDGHMHRIQRPLRGEVHHVVVEGGAEEHRLPLALLGRLVDDAAHVRDETHVQHPIRLVDHQHFHMAQAGEPLAGEIEQPARRRHQQVNGPATQLFPLLGVVDAAHQTDNARVDVAGEIARVLFDLQREFARWRQHERPGGARWQRVGRGELQLPSKNGDEKRRGLASAGLRLAGDVVVRQAVRQHFALDGGAALEPEVVDGGHHRPRQCQLVEANRVLGLGHCRFFTHGRITSLFRSRFRFLPFGRPPASRKASARQCPRPQLPRWQRSARCGCCDRLDRARGETSHRPE